MGKTALVTGISGQDGSYLAELLLSKDYRVIGTVRSKSPKWPWGFNPEHPNLEIMQLDLGFYDNIQRLFRDCGNIDELYNLAAQSHVGYSFEHPEETYKVTGVGACLLMDEYFLNYPNGKFYQASSSEMFGDHGLGNYKLGRYSDFFPVSPYGISKLMAHYNAVKHNMQDKFCCSGILFNHESPRRHESFVTQKICKYAVMAHKWQKGYDDIKEKPILRLGNISVIRDWGYAPEYVEIMHNMMQKEESRDWVIGTGTCFSVNQFAEKAFEYVDLDWQNFTEENILTFKRPNDIVYLCADSREANKLLDKSLTSTGNLIKIMMEHQKFIQGVEDE